MRKYKIDNASYKLMFFNNLPYKNVDNIVKNYKSRFGVKEKFPITLA